MFFVLHSLAYKCTVEHNEGTDDEGCPRVPHRRARRAQQCVPPKERTDCAALAGAKDLTNE